jgi:hypothetical protein
VTSVYAQDFEGVLSDQFHKKVSFDGISDELIEPLKNATFQNLEQLCLNFSDGYVMGDVETPDFIQKYSNENEIPGLNYQESQNEDALVKFYNNIILK